MNFKVARAARNRQKFLKDLDERLDEIQDVEELKEIIEIVPEHSGEIYETLLHKFLFGFGENILPPEDVDFLEDILVPMADYERYKYYYFSDVRKYMSLLLEFADANLMLWDVVYVLENGFNIPHKQIETNIHWIMKDHILDFSKWLMIKSKPESFTFDNEDLEEIKYLFKDKEGYDTFMDSLPEVLGNGGLELYTILIKLLGKNPEVMKFYNYCIEFDD